MKLNLILLALICLAASFSLPACAQNSGAEIFKANCQMCHGPDGLSNTPVARMLKIPSLKDPKVVSAPDSALIAQVQNGKNKMPPFKGKLTDAQIKSVIAYVRTLQK
jgi:cytochrome c6